MWRRYEWSIQGVVNGNKAKLGSFTSEERVRIITKTVKIWFSSWGWLN